LPSGAIPYECAARYRRATATSGSSSDSITLAIEKLPLKSPPAVAGTGNGTDDEALSERFGIGESSGERRVTAAAGRPCAKSW
jgi:hypothetical protein